MNTFDKWIKNAKFKKAFNQSRENLLLMENEPLILFLCAGKGSRLGDLTKDIPKALVTLGDKSLIARNIEAFESHGIQKANFVLGHGSFNLDNFLYNNYKEKFLRRLYSTVYNARYETDNNAYSTLFGLKHSQLYTTSSLYIVNTDIIYPPEILKDLIECEFSSLLVDNKKQLSIESMKVYTLSGRKRLTAISKKLDYLQSSGEYIGITKIIKSDVEKFLIALKTVTQIDHDMFYEDALHIMCNWTRIECVYTKDKPWKWTEIDTPEDLAYARTLV